MTRPAIAHIRLDAFRHNYRVAKQMHGGKALAVIKANAYGHGAVQCAKAIENEADGFAVACLEEAIELRKAGIKAPILLLEGFFEVNELPEIVANNLWIVVHAQWQVEMWIVACAAWGYHLLTIHKHLCAYASIQMLQKLC
jgi:alanine racemase